MSSTTPVVESGQIVRAPALLDLLRTLWRRLLPPSQARTRRLATLSDHLLTDIGVHAPGYEQPRHIHRQ